MKKIFLMLIIIASLFSLTACEDSTEKVVEKAEVESEPDPIYNPLTNEQVSEEIQSRAILVSIDNHPDARPHYGISAADMVYEVPAEGSIPRLVALFYSEVPDHIGPVRSARPYMVDIAREWDGVFAHCGGSQEALSYLRRSSVIDMDEISWSRYFWRENDTGRWAPHNLMTSEENITDYLEYREVSLVDENIRQMLFLGPYDERLGEEADWINVEFPTADNYYKYDEESGMYLRSIGDEPYIDATTGEQVEVANIIIQRVYSYYADSYGHLGIDMCAGGDAWLFSGGTVLKGTWQRTDLDSPTIFVDERGVEFQLNAGQTWIEVINSSVSFSYKDTTVETNE